MRHSTNRKCNRQIHKMPTREFRVHFHEIYCKKNWNRPIRRSNLTLFILNFYCVNQLNALQKHPFPWNDHLAYGSSLRFIQYCIHFHRSPSTQRKTQPRKKLFNVRGSNRTPRDKSMTSLPPLQASKKRDGPPPHG